MTTNAILARTVGESDEDHDRTPIMPLANMLIGESHYTPVAQFQFPVIL
jgi:hypothetical protein